MWDFLTKKCGIFGIEGGTKLWDFQHQGGDFRPLTSGHTDGERRVGQTFFKMRIGEMILLPDKSKLYDGILWYINGCNANWIGF